MPENVIAVPVSRSTNRPAQLYTDDVYVEYFTPKGFKKYQSELATPSEEQLMPASDNTYESPGWQEDRY